MPGDVEDTGGLELADAVVELKDAFETLVDVIEEQTGLRWRRRLAVLLAAVVVLSRGERATLHSINGGKSA